MGTESNKPLEYEAEVLTANNEPILLGYARNSLLDYADDNYNPDKTEGGKLYKPVTLQGKKDFAFFNAAYVQMQAILAVDKNNCFDSVEQLFGLSKTNHDEFERLYKIATTANPTLIPEPESESESESDNKATEKN